MHLIAALAAGVRGAELGTAQLFKRGTSTRATWYASFEADGPNSTGADIQLDSYGGAVVFVGELVDVIVKASSDNGGATIREFCAGVRDDAVEVESPSFTGVDYETGQSGLNEPTTLSAVLDRWITSAGAPDFNVAFGGSSITLAQAVAGNIYINVQGADYGAVGDGVTDDTAAINAAILDAFDAGGVTVFFPPGTYLVSSPIIVKANVSLLGAGTLNSSTTVLTRTTSDFVLLDCEDNSSVSIKGIRILDAATGANADLITAPSGLTLLVQECRIGGTFVGGTKAAVLSNTAGTVAFVDCFITVCSPGGAIATIASIVWLTRCTVSLVDDSSSAFTASTVRGRIYATGCSFSSTVAVGLAPANGILRLSGFSAVVGNSFSTGLSLPDALVAMGSDSTGENSVIESGNTMDDSFTTLSVGGTGLMRSLSRDMRHVSLALGAPGTANINPDFGINTVTTSGIAGTYTMAFSTTNRSKSGAMWIIVRNTSGANHLIDFTGTSPADVGVAVNAGLILRALYLFTTVGASTTWFRMTGFTVSAI